jgi:hypothetical protein
MAVMRSFGLLLVLLQSMSYSLTGILAVVTKSRIQRRPWDDVFTAFRRFKEVRLDEDAVTTTAVWSVPQSFVVPHSDAWPPSTRGIKLGQIACDIRNSRTYIEHRGELEAIGFNYEIIGKQLFSWDEIVSALQCFKRLYESSADKWTVPTSFVVPDGDDKWPSNVWGMRLGRTVSNIRNQNSYRMHREELESMGLDCSCQQLDGARMLLALGRYKELYVDPTSTKAWKIPQSFIVPHNSSDWPPSLWGVRLGLTARTIRNKFSFKEQRGELEAMGFDFEIVGKQQFSWEDIRLALERYKELYAGSGAKWSVKTTFVVSVDDPLWPESTWGMRLGRTAHGIRHYQYFKERRSELEAMGFNFDARGVTWEDTSAALQCYKRLYVSADRWTVPKSFVVPDGDDKWPSTVWGMRLGRTVANIRNQNSYRTHQEELERMGFDFSMRTSGGGKKTRGDAEGGVEGGVEGILEGVAEEVGGEEVGGTAAVDEL